MEGKKHSEFSISDRTFSFGSKIGVSFPLLLPAASRGPNASLRWKSRTGRVGRTEVQLIVALLNFIDAHNEHRGIPNSLLMTSPFLAARFANC